MKEIVESQLTGQDNEDNHLELTLDTSLPISHPSHLGNVVQPPK